MSGRWMRAACGAAAREPLGERRAARSWRSRNLVIVLTVSETKCPSSPGQHSAVFGVPVLAVLGVAVFGVRVLAVPVLSIHHHDCPRQRPSEGIFPRWISRGVRAGGGDGSSGGWRLQYCLTVMDGVAKHLPSRDGLFAASPMGGIAVVPPTEMSYAVGCSLFKPAVLPRSWDRAAPAGGGSFYPPGFHID